MKIKLQSFAITCAALLIMLASSCKKESSSTSAAVGDQEAQTITQENAAAEAEFNDITEIGLSTGADLEAVASTNSTEVVGGAAGTGLGFRLDLFTNLQWKIGPCTSIQVEPDDSTYPKTVTINYGEGCICRDGKFRKGAIILYFTGPIRRPGSELVITFRDYYVNRAHVEGRKTIDNLSENGVIKYSTKVENGAITWPNGRGFKFEAGKMVTQVDGMDTRTIRDDVYSIEGRSQVSYANGFTVTRNTETPLIKPVACNWFVQGVLKVTINSNRVFYIDFGNGECDNKATVKWANGEIEIRLP